VFATVLSVRAALYVAWVFELNMYGPKFNSNTQATYNAALTDNTVANTAQP